MIRVHAIVQGRLPTGRQVRTIFAKRNELHTFLI
ncbi:MAG: hypothetical protein ACD_7C00004G0002 [uncultured bacterium]|nr:MAG: hypothetical protein ACD_7C00004G0002 [uncultured bacterium]